MDRRDQREQQRSQPQASGSNSRYTTAAGSEWNPITMKTQIADEFFKPGGQGPK